jgi:hypothetical protein
VSNTMRVERLSFVDRSLWYWRETGRDSGIVTGNGLDGPGIESLWGNEFFRTCPDRPGGQPHTVYNGYRVFSGGKAAGSWSWPPTPLRAEVKERVELYLYSPLGLCGLL